GHRSRKPYVKDAFHRTIVDKKPCVNPDRVGTKTALHYYFPAVAAGGSVVLGLRLEGEEGAHHDRSPLADVDAVDARRMVEADECYNSLHKPGSTDDEKRVQRQAWAGLLWTKQSYLFDVDIWLKGDFPEMPPPESRTQLRNVHWRHLNTMRIMTVPD